MRQLYAESYTGEDMVAQVAAPVPVQPTKPVQPQAAAVDVQAEVDAERQSTVKLLLGFAHVAQFIQHSEQLSNLLSTNRWSAEQLNAVSDFYRRNFTFTPDWKFEEVKEKLS